MIFTSPTERSLKRGDCLSTVPPLLEFVRLRPSTDVPLACLLPGAETPFGSTVPPVESRSVLVVSHHLDGLLHTNAAGLLHPAAGLGFVTFCASDRHLVPEGTRWFSCTPRDADRTLRRVFLARSRSVSLRSLPSYCYCQSDSTSNRSRCRVVSSSRSREASVCSHLRRSVRAQN